MNNLFSIVLLILSSASHANSHVPLLPDPNLTPGVTLSVTATQICKIGYTKSVRNVSDSTKEKVFQGYGIDPNSDKFEVDHLISLELGGSNDERNLWPQSYTTPMLNARSKDVLENKLHKLVCAGKMPLKDAQALISHNWIDAYHTYVKK